MSVAKPLAGNKMISNEYRAHFESLIPSYATIILTSRFLSTISRMWTLIVPTDFNEYAMPTIRWAVGFLTEAVARTQAGFAKVSVGAPFPQRIRWVLPGSALTNPYQWKPPGRAESGTTLWD